MTSKEQVRISLIRTIERLHFPTEFGEMIADSLGTEKQMQRMTSWIIQYHPKRMEDVADEMLAIKAEFARYKEKFIAEYNNRKYNELIQYGLGNDDEEEK